MSRNLLSSASLLIKWKEVKNQFAYLPFRMSVNDIDWVVETAGVFGNFTSAIGKVERDKSPDFGLRRYSFLKSLNFQ